ncbi:MAG: hypothetical protein ACJAZ3_001370 [Sphingobacteriales bacterium]|jgi:hypothetical protein
MCNFKRLGEHNMSIDPKTNEFVIKNLAEGGAPSKSMVIKSDGSFDITAPAKSYLPNDFGLYNTNGNVAEMISEKGIALGGSWNSLGFDVRCESEMTYDLPTPEIGFRPIIVINN